jgi:hypothetical protein
MGSRPRSESGSGNRATTFVHGAWPSLPTATALRAGRWMQRGRRPWTESWGSSGPAVDELAARLDDRRDRDHLRAFRSRPRRTQAARGRMKQPRDGTEARPRPTQRPCPVSDVHAPGWGRCVFHRAPRRRQARRQRGPSEAAGVQYWTGCKTFRIRGEEYSSVLAILRTWSTWTGWLISAVQYCTPRETYVSAVNIDRGDQYLYWLRLCF